MKFTEGFKKVATGGANKPFWESASKLDKAGLGLLAVAPAYHLHKTIKEKDPVDAAATTAELGGLGLLYRAVQKGKK